MDNFYLINKPLNFTSFDAVKFLRGKLKEKRIGHTGTLDPLATGVLLIVTGNYTKLIPYLEKSSKEYEFSVNFDGITDSYDLGTPVNFISSEEQKIASKNISKEKIEKILLEKFTGEIKQIPPKYSALKIGGEKALDKVLKGKDFEMKERFCKIYKIEILEYNYPTAKFKALVSAGTYVRSIAYDLGNLLGTGGYVTSLKRTKIGDLDVNSSQNLDNFDITNVLDINNLFKGKKFIKLDNEIIEKLNMGIKVKRKFDYTIGDELFVGDGKIITNIIKYDGEYLIPKRRIKIN